MVSPRFWLPRLTSLCHCCVVDPGGMNVEAAPTDAAIVVGDDVRVVNDAVVHDVERIGGVRVVAELVVRVMRIREESRERAR